MVSAFVALIPEIPQIQLLIVTQSIAGFLLPVLLVAIILLSSNREIMGDYKNSKAFNVLAWAVAAVVMALSLLLIGKTIADMF